MSLLAHKLEILRILAANLDNAQPQAIDSHVISRKLDLDFSKTCQMVKILNGMELIESDQEGLRSLITRRGLLHLKEMELSKAA